MKAKEFGPSFSERLAQSDRATKGRFKKSAAITGSAVVATGLLAACSADSTPNNQQAVVQPTSSDPTLSLIQKLTSEPLKLIPDRQNSLTQTIPDDQDVLVETDHGQVIGVVAHPEGGLSHQTNFKQAGDPNGCDEAGFAEYVKRNQLMDRYYNDRGVLYVTFSRAETFGQILDETHQQSMPMAYRVSNGNYGWTQAIGSDHTDLTHNLVSSNETFGVINEILKNGATRQGIVRCDCLNPLEAPVGTPIPLATPTEQLVISTPTIFVPETPTIEIATALPTPTKPAIYPSFPNTPTPIMVAPLPQPELSPLPVPQVNICLDGHPNTIVNVPDIVVLARQRGFIGPDDLNAMINFLDKSCLIVPPPPEVLICLDGHPNTQVNLSEIPLLAKLRGYAGTNDINIMIDYLNRSCIFLPPPPTPFFITPFPTPTGFPTPQFTPTAPATASSTPVVFMTPTPENLLTATPTTGRPDTPTSAPTNIETLPTLTPGETSTLVPTRTPGGNTETPIGTRPGTPIRENTPTVFRPNTPTSASTNIETLPTLTPGETSTLVPTRTPGGNTSTPIGTRTSIPTPDSTPTVFRPNTPTEAPTNTRPVPTLTKGATSTLVPTMTKAPNTVTPIGTRRTVNSAPVVFPTAPLPSNNRTEQQSNPSNPTNQWFNVNRQPTPNRNINITNRKISDESQYTLVPQVSGQESSYANWDSLVGGLALVGLASIAAVKSFRKLRK